MSHWSHYKERRERNRPEIKGPHGPMWSTARFKKKNMVSDFDVQESRGIKALDDTHAHYTDKCSVSLPHTHKSMHLSAALQY